MIEVVDAEDIQIGDRVVGSGDEPWSDCLHGEVTEIKVDNDLVWALHHQSNLQPGELPVIWSVVGLDGCWLIDR